MSETILNNLKQTCGEMQSFAQIRTPKLSNIELVSLNLTAEYMSINTELQLFRCLKGTYLESTIERSVYNKRRKKLFDYTESIRKRISQKFVEFTDVFVVDSMPTPICKYARAARSSICSSDHIQPTFGHCDLQKSRYYGYKLYAGTSKNTVMIQIWTALETILGLKALVKHKLYLSKLVSFIRLNIFMKVDLQMWLDNPFQKQILQ